VRPGQDVRAGPRKDRDDRQRTGLDGLRRERHVRAGIGGDTGQWRRAAARSGAAALLGVVTGQRRGVLLVVMVRRGVPRRRHALSTRVDGPPRAGATGKPAGEREQRGETARSGLHVDRGSVLSAVAGAGNEARRPRPGRTGTRVRGMVSGSTSGRERGPDRDCRTPSRRWSGGPFPARDPLTNSSWFGGRFCAFRRRRRERRAE
jgi:hypothetical protein